MMTCRLAFSYNRDVYALPGRIDDIRSQGCNELIRQKMAEPMTSLSSLIRDLGMKTLGTASGTDGMEMLYRHYQGQLEEDDMKLTSEIISVLRNRRAVTVEELSRLLGVDYSRATRLTGLLEIDGFISKDLMQRCSINSKFM